jgi:hypothetical protein
MGKLTLSLSFLLLVGGPASAQQIQSYCISGTSTGVNYAWAVDLGGDGFVANEPVELNAPAPLPGATADILAQAFSQSIATNLTAISVQLYTAWVLGSTCFDLAWPLAGVVLWVGPAGLHPVTSGSGCPVTLTPCDYNPTIVLAPPVPTLDRYGVAAAALCVLAGGWLLLRRRRLSARAS